MRRIVLGIVVGCSGCTAAKATIQIVGAEQALRRADDYNCAQGAAYEYVMASEYLQKAREEAGYSEFRVADALARQSAVWSDRAIIFVERKGQEVDLEDFADPVPPPVEAPPPVEPEPRAEPEFEFELDDE